MKIKVNGSKNESKICIIAISFAKSGKCKDDSFHQCKRSDFNFFSEMIQPKETQTKTGDHLKHKDNVRSCVQANCFCQCTKKRIENFAGNQKVVFKI